MRRNEQGELGIMLLAVLMVAGTSLQAKEIVYNSEGRRDPFVPLTSTEEMTGTRTVSGFHLEGIIYDPNKQSMVVLNGKTYLQGETIGNAIVKLIRKNYVMISVNGEDKTLMLREDERSRKT